MKHLQTGPIRAISLVPSLTETLIACGVNLVGRSRFCIHPAEKVAKIPKVGGTKDVNWDKVSAVKPDILILDKEENTLEMAESCPFDYIALHITSIADIPKEFAKLAIRLESPELEKIADRWQAISLSPLKDQPIENLPGVIEWWRQPMNQTNLEYLIWREPWMAAGEEIFIQSMLDFVGYKTQRTKHLEKYPTIDLADYDPKETTLLFSSEPYPFQNFKDDMLSLGFSCALVDGEKYSWYGLRSLEFLEQLQKINRE